MCTTGFACGAKTLCCSSRRKMYVQEREKKRQDFFVESIQKHFYARGRILKISQQAPLSVGMPVKKLYIFLPLGQKVVLIRCSKRFSRSGDGRLVYFFYQPQRVRAFGENNAEQRLVAAAPPRLRLFLYEIRPQVALLRQQLPSAPKRDARAQRNRTSRHLSPSFLHARSHKTERS
jgi:hypothetical protein